jgi:hypothetical protein
MMDQAIERAIEAFKATPKTKPISDAVRAAIAAYEAAAEIDRLRAERDALAAQLQALRAPAGDDELEVAARALARVALQSVDHLSADVVEQLIEHGWQSGLKYARAVLAAVRPRIVEQERSPEMAGDKVSEIDPDTVMIFVREEGFYPIHAVKNIDLATQAADHARVNPGTLRVEDIEGNVLWPKQ